MKAWLNLASLKDPLCFKSWLYTIARNTVRDYWRSKKVLNQHQSWEQLEKTDISSGILGPEDRIIKAELVQLALAELPAKFRDCLLLHIVGGLSHTEIADIVDISEDSVRSYISSARKQFRKTYLDLENGTR